jgi:predicted CDP-diglyceride synthetase/phosphatidate cytidylyltransferase
MMWVKCGTEGLQLYSPNDVVFWLKLCIKSNSFANFAGRPQHWAVLTLRLWVSVTLGTWLLLRLLFVVSFAQSV